MSTASTWASPAALSALLKYEPQKEGLADLKREAVERFNSSVAAGQSEGTLAKQAAQAAVAPTKQVFANASTEGQRGRDLIAPILAALAPGSPFATAAANEQAAGTERLAGAKAHSLSDLQQKKAAAAALPGYSRQAASSALLAELVKLNAKGQALQGAQGLTETAEAQKERHEASTEAAKSREGALNRAQSQTNAEISHSPKVGANGAAELTPKEQASGASTIKSILGYAKTGVQSGETRQQLVARLSAGRPQQSVAVNEKGEPVKEGEKAVQHVAVPKIPAYKADSLMSAALDVAESGHVSLGVQRQLEKEGYNVHSLGLPLAPKGAKGVAQAVNDVGKKVVKAIGNL